MSLPEVGHNQREYELFFTPTSFLEDFYSQIRNATRSIDIEMFILENGEVTKKIFHYLEMAANRGVKVRLLVDGVGSLPWLMSSSKDPHNPNIEVRIFNPLKWYMFSRRWNQRNHRKTIVIDNKLAYIGSFNFSDRYIDWRETSLKIESKLVTNLQNIFNYTWCSINLKFPKGIKQYRAIRKAIITNKSIHTTYLLGLRKRYRTEFIKLIDQATTRVWLMSPYFNPPGFLIAALIRAANRGVDVKLVLPKVLDLPILRWLAQLYYRVLIMKRIRIYEYLPSVMHAKTYLMDDTAIVGTGNLNYRSFYLDIELNLVLKESYLIEKVVDQFTLDIKKSRLVTLNDQMPFYKQIIARLLSLWKTSM
jgi:cardiolipin synthase A/B